MPSTESKSQKNQTENQYVRDLLRCKPQIECLKDPFTLEKIGVDMTRDFPCVVLIGAQSSSKSMTMSRILKCVEAPSDNKRCTKALYEFTMIAAEDEDQTGFRVRITNDDDVFFEGNLKLDNEEDRELLRQELIAAQEKIGQKPEFRDKHFYNTYIKTEIESNKIDDSYYNLCGLWELKPIGNMGLDREINASLEMDKS